MENINFPDKIRYVFSTDPDVHLRVAHGIWGGINPHGEIELNFYDESDAPPEFTEQGIEADGTPGQERVPQQDVIRQVNRQIHTRVLLNYNTARAVLNWLEDRVAELESSSSTELYDIGSGIQQ